MSWRHSWPVTGLSTEEPIETTNQPWKSEALNHLLQWCKPEGNAWDSADSPSPTPAVGCCTDMGIVSLLKETEQKPRLPRFHSGKEFACQCRRHKKHGFSLWWGKTPWGGNDNPLLCSCLRNPMDRGAWGAAVNGVAQDQTDWVTEPEQTSLQF